jgi:hypothetical protein
MTVDPNPIVKHKLIFTDHRQGCVKLHCEGVVDRGGDGFN